MSFYTRSSLSVNVGFNANARFHTSMIFSVNARFHASMVFNVSMGFHASMVFSVNVGFNVNVHMSMIFDVNARFHAGMIFNVAFNVSISQNLPQKFCNKRTDLMRKVLNWLLETALYPPRMLYDLDDAVCAVTMGPQCYVRKDVAIKTSHDGHTIRGSLWRDLNCLEPRSCLIFLHALGTNQFECLHLVPFLCQRDLAVFAFDFQCHGLADGGVIPLIGGGSADVLAVVEHLRSEFSITNFALWGRSMGAAVALDVASITGELFSCVIADSGFASTRDVIEYQARVNGFPSCITSLLYKYAKRRIQRRLGMEIDCEFPMTHVSRAKAPLLIGHGSTDAFVPIEQGYNVYSMYGADEKQMYIFPGKHNSHRPRQWYESAARFLYRKLNISRRVRDYEQIYKYSRLHIGDPDRILCDIHRDTEPDIETRLNQTVGRGRALSELSSTFESDSYFV